jgi:hypothetical protein
MCAAVGFASQTTENSFDKAKIEALNTEKRAFMDPITLSYKPLDIDTPRITVYTDSTFANCGDKSSQLGFVILLTDFNGNCVFLDYTSWQSKRIVRFVLRAEMLAFSEGFDRAFAIRHELKSLLSSTVPISVLTDSKGLFDVIVESSSTQERRLMIDVAAAKQAYDCKDTSDIGFIRSPFNIAEGFTKPGICSALVDCLKTGWIIHPVEQ